MSTHASSKLAIASLFITAALATVAVTAVAAEESDKNCAANLFLDPAEPFESQDQLLGDLAEAFLHDADSIPAIERPAFLAVAEAASAVRAMARDNPNQDVYAVAGGEGRAAEIHLEQVDGGWVAEHLTVFVPSTVCEALAGRDAASTE